MALVIEEELSELKKLADKVLAWCLQGSVRETYKGIQLCDCNFDDSDDSAFLRWTREALDFIEQEDPRRFRRVQKEVKCIVNKELSSVGQYRKEVKSCMVDFGRYRFESNPEWYLCLYAGTIVHEATHGVLFRKGHPYTPTNRERIERICHAEECRFYVRAAPQHRDTLVREFDASRYNRFWNGTRWTELRTIINRIRESRKKANKCIQTVVRSSRR